MNYVIGETVEISNGEKSEKYRVQALTQIHGSVSAVQLWRCRTITTKIGRIRFPNTIIIRVIGRSAPVTQAQ